MLGFLFVAGLFLSHPAKASAATISGIARINDITYVDTSTKVTLLVDGSFVQTYTIPDNSGTFSFTGVTLSSSSIITLFLDDYTHDGVTVIHSDTSNLSNILVYKDRLILRNDNGTSALTPTDLDTANNGDSDITTIYSNGSTATIQSGKTLYIASGTFTIVDALTIQGNLYIGPSTTFDAGSAVVNLRGDFTNEGTFSHSGTVNLTISAGAGAAQRITTTTPTTFYNLSRTEGSNNLDTTIYFNGDITISNNLTLNGLDSNDRIIITSEFNPNLTTPVITFTGSSTFTGDYLIVSYNEIVNNSSGVTLPLSPANSTDGGDTVGWFGSDVTAPTISEVTPVTNPTNDTTPNYTFTTNEAGTISYGGSCTSATTSASLGSNTITFSTLSAGTYSNCTITVTDGSSNASSPLSVTSFTIDTTAPTISEVTPVSTPTADTTPSYTFTTNEAGSITYGGSCSSSVGSSASSGNNTITFDTLGSGAYSNCTITVTDAAGNASTPLTVTSFTIDAVAPRVASISTNKADGTYTVGEVIDIDVTFSEAVSDLGGGVMVTLETGTTDRTCSFAIVTSTTGTCNYTVQSGDTTTDLSGTVSGTIIDQVGNALVNFTPTGNNINTNHAIVIDAINPSISTLSPADNATGVSLNANLIMTFDGPVTIGTGNITVKTTSGNTTVETIDVTSGLVTGGGTAIITINPSTTLTGLTEYYVLVDATAFDDVAGNSYAGIASTTAWSFTTGDGTAPTITNVSSDKTNGSYTVGEVIDIDVTFSEAVTSTGNVTVTLETGDNDRTCTFTVTNASSGTCNYTVQTGDTSSDLTVHTISGTITDQSSNPMTDFAPATNLAANKALVIDTTGPTLSEVTPVSTPTTDQTPNYTFTTNEAGTITYGGSCSSGTTSASSGSNTITFSTLGDGTYSNCTVRVTDTAGNISSALSVTTFIVDINLPTVLNVTSSPTSGAYKLGQSVTIQVVFSEVVTVASGTPQLTLETGTTDRTVNYVSGTGSTTLVFTYTVQSGDTSADLDYTTTSALTLNGATIRDVVAHDATLTLATPGASGSLGANANNIIDTTAPVISEVTPVTTPSTDSTPNYTFTSDEAGTISYGGSCTSGTTSASVGSNTITFSNLSNGTYTNCTVTVTDVATNVSNTLAVTAFEVAVVSSGGGGGGMSATVCPSGTTGFYPNCVTTVVQSCIPGQLFNTMTGLPCSSSSVLPVFPPNVPAIPSLSGCSQIIKYPIVLGRDNLRTDVNNLVTFLNTYEGEHLAVDGIYGVEDVAAVKRFQIKYWDEIIAPFGGKVATGTVGNYTRGKINAMNCAKNTGCPFFTGVQKYKTSGGEQLGRLQTYLNLLMGTNLQESSYNFKVFKAIEAYQNVYKKKILKPFGLSRGTGNWGLSTVKISNEIIGCVQK